MNPPRILTAATPGHYAGCAGRLKFEAERLGLECVVVPLPDSYTGDRSCRWKPRAIQLSIEAGWAPFWYVDADDLLTAAPGIPGPDCSFGWVRNPELSVIPTELRIADCVHYWSGAEICLSFLDYWRRLCPLTINSHRALAMAFHGFWIPCQPGLSDVTPCLSGRYIMTSRGSRPEARL
jgi:hypothetical protein